MGLLLAVESCRGLRRGPVSLPCLIHVYSSEPAFARWRSEPRSPGQRRGPRCFCCGLARTSTHSPLTLQTRRPPGPVSHRGCCPQRAALPVSRCLCISPASMPHRGPGLPSPRKHRVPARLVCPGPFRARRVDCSPGAGAGGRDRREVRVRGPGWLPSWVPGGAWKAAARGLSFLKWRGTSRQGDLEAPHEQLLQVNRRPQS